MLHFQQAGAGIPLILLHAFPLSSAMWQPQLDYLSDEYRVIAPDLPGFGHSPNLDAIPSLDDMARSVARLLDELKLTEPVILGGLSMGGYAALSFAKQFPERLRALILCDTRAEADTEEAKTNRDKLIALAQSKGSAAVVEQMIPKLLGENTKKTQPTIVEDVRAMGLRQSSTAIIYALRALRDRANSVSFLPQIRVPTLILVGEEDTITPLSAAETLARGIDNSKLVTIPHAGHLASLENPQAFNQEVRDFASILY